MEIITNPFDESDDPKVKIKCSGALLWDHMVYEVPKDQRSDYGYDTSIIEAHLSVWVKALNGGKLGGKELLHELLDLFPVRFHTCYPRKDAPKSGEAKHDPDLRRAVYASAFVQHLSRAYEDHQKYPSSDAQIKVACNFAAGYVVDYDRSVELLACKKVVDLEN